MSISSKKKKALTTVGAVALALIIALGGTFAWQSISQIALNEKADKIEVGGRLHDDFNGEDKNVYAENFGDAPVFVRIKLNEYLEVGDGAGLYEVVKNEETGEETITVSADNKAKSVVDGAKLDDKSTWTTHIPNPENVADCNSVFHDSPYNVLWTMGGQGTFLPTFNMDPDSLDSDQRGHFVAPGSADNYKDYKIYEVGETEQGQELPSGESATHTAKSTLTSEVITMAQWKALGSPIGDYWVYDTDGWAYWAAPIPPGEATGLLLDSIDVSVEEGEYYYAIDVISQFCSAGEIFENTDTTADGDKVTEDAKALLEALSEDTHQLAPTGIEVTAVGDADLTSVAKGSVIEFKSKATINNGESTNRVEQDVFWSLEGTPTGITIEGNKVTVGEDAVAGELVTVTATSVKDSTVSGSTTFTVAED